MHVYWQSVTQSGAPSEGAFVFQGNLKALQQHLYSQGHFQLQIQVIPTRDLHRLATDEWLQNFVTQWSQLSSSGLNLIECFRFLIRDQSRPFHKFVLCDVLQQLQQGKSLQAAFGAHVYFPPLFTRLLAVAENSDQLPEVLRALQQLYQQRVKARQERLKLLRYPLTIAGFASFIFLGCVIFLIPLFRNIYQTQGDQLFWLSRGLLIMSDSLRVNALYWLLGGGALMLSLWVTRHRWSAFPWHWLPILGNLHHSTQVLLYAHAMRLMTKVQLPLQEALKLTEPLFTGPLHESCATVRDALLQGDSIFVAYRRSKIFEDDLLRLIALGESSEQISYAFGRIAEHQTERLEQERNRLNALVEPLTMALISLLVLALLLAMYLPLFQMGLASR
jgi:type II secretory pathway component PulF